ncbi:hypothetical protein XELAEV_18025000mg [Xenopus laevis]|uniref:Hydrocephalus-inducing protein homolog n=1 Tax=Xenopus laevis TaxID=8355 RepID=A0A974D1I6_XENLA|nr:hypothetical protein XELAEV_18025000mg [Xenopus laevis]
MPTSKLQGTPKSVQELPFKMSSRFQSKVVAPRNPKLIRDEQPSLTLTPSAFLKEMSLSTEERLANTREMHPPKIIQLLDMSETTYQKFSTVDLDQALFQPFPSEIVFQNYTACETYEVPLILRNNDKVPRLVKVIQENSPYFQIISPNDVCNKVAPGMPSIFRILFTPEENKDYFHELVCVTEREKFVVPVRAVGARALLDFPDQLNFLLCPVKYNSQKTLLVRNIGNREARFQLFTQCPFIVSPLSGTLAVGESTQVIVEFLPLEVGDHAQDMIIHYDTGEDVHVSLYGAATDINVRLDKNSLIIEKTYLSLTSQRTVTISNRSDIIAHFQWKTFSSQQEEEHQKLRFCSDLKSEEEAETDRFLEECSADHSIRERLSLLSRTFQNRRKMVEGDNMLFSDDIFHIEPVEGDVWPNSSVEVTVLFKPQAPKIYQRTIYCDITGRETRLPLRIRGEGLGPKLHFNFDQLDIGKIFVGSIHSYEAILTNRGAVDGIFTLIPPSSAVGSCFTFSPNEGIILPAGHQAIQITVCSSVLGEFKEEFHFSVDGACEAVKLTISGCIIGPTFHFSVPSLQFGDISFGFPSTLTFSLNNTSLVPMTFELRIPGDGTGEPSITSSNQILNDRSSSWRRRVKLASPKEFSIIPSRGTIRSQGQLDIQVTICSNQVKRYEMALVVDVDGIGDEVLALPITARCVVPTVCLEDSTLKFSRCFLHYPYEKTMTLKNLSNLPACYGLEPQEPDATSTVLYYSPKPCGIIEPQKSVDVPIILNAQVTGDQGIKAKIALFGCNESPLEVLLLCTGEGPVVHVYPTEMDFGNIKVLTDIPRILHLSNQSLIPARFMAHMTRKRSLWRIEPSHGEVPPHGEIQLTVFAHLDDTVSFQDRIQLMIENSNTYFIPLHAKGIGTTIVTDKPFAPVLNLGAHFSAGPCQYHFTMTNRGRRTQQLYWMTDGFSLQRKRSQPANIKTGATNSKITSPVFKLRPSRMELTPGQSVDVLLEGFSDLPLVVKEKLVGQAIIGNQTGKETIMMVDVICEFIAPVLNLSSENLHFYTEKQPDDCLVPMYESLRMKNISSLPLTIFLTLNEPFSLCNNDNPGDRETKPHILEAGEEKEITVRFDPTYIHDLRSRVIDEVLTIRYAEHPHTDHISIQAEVHFPNLHFPTTQIHFGCILNDTESVQELTVTNNSPLPVHYRWSYLTEKLDSQIRDAYLKKQETSQTSYIEENGIIPNSELHFQNLIENYDEKDLMSESEQDELNQDHHLPVLPILDKATMSEEDHVITGVEEVFDIMPLFGTLQPGDSQIICFTFYGHTGISAQAKALCDVIGGPTYEISLEGEASLVSYTLSTKDINYGIQRFDQVAEANVILKNTGKVDFPFTVLNQNCEGTMVPRPGEPLIQPVSGHIAAGEEGVLKVSYFSGIPESFQRVIQLQVGHFEPESITLQGEAVFPRICLDLPRNIKENEKLQAYLREAEGNMMEKKHIVNSLVPPANMESSFEPSATDMDSLLMMEMERLFIKEHATEQLMSEGVPTVQQKLLKVLLPDYVLDFGFVILGDVRTHIVKITNTSHFPVSFRADRRGLVDSGFSVELDRVKNLPCCQTETFQVKFDPRGANLNLGPVEAIMIIQVSGGSKFPVRLRATVTMPSLCTSSDRVEFSPVQCGQCEIRSIQLYNPLPVMCEWTVMSQDNEIKIDKHTPLHLRKKLRQDLKPKPPIFELMPAAGILLPSQKKNVEIRFIPQEEKLYSQRLVLQVAQSSQRVMILVEGRGMEPHLEFTPSVLELGPILPFSSGDDVEVLVKNPCSFPIEFYCLEMDKQYLEEEKILRMLKGYDSQNTLLLPPRFPGEKLPSEILEYYNEQKRVQEETVQSHLTEYQERGAVEETEEEQVFELSEKQELLGTQHIPSNASCAESHSSLAERNTEEAEEPEKRAGSGEKMMKSDITKEVGELDQNPVSLAIARYMGIDISSEGRASSNRRGIAIIAHGAPVTGKSSTAVTLAQHYNIPCLSIDSVVLDAISDGNSPTGMRARQLCSKAAFDMVLRQSEETGLQATEAISGQPGLSMEALAKHTAEGGQGTDTKTGPYSVISRANRGSIVAGKGKSESHQMQGAKQQHLSEPAGSQTESSPFPAGPTQKRLSVSASVGGELGLMSCVLPDDLLEEIISERLQLNDCFRGVIFDGLDTLFARNAPSALLSLLKSLNNRQHIYIINLHQDYAIMKEREKVQRQKEEGDRLCAEAKNRARIEEMDEEEYDNLPDDERAHIDRLRLIAIRERKKREQEDRLAREEQQRKLQEELLRQREEDELKKKTRRGKSREDTSGKKSQIGSKQMMNLHAGKSEVRIDSGLERKVSVKDRPESVANDLDEAFKRRKSKDFKGGIGDIIQQVSVPDDSEKEVVSESEKKLIQRFKNYESCQKEILQICTLWDRVQGIMVSPTVEGSQHEGEELIPERQLPSGKRNRKDRERDRHEKLEREKAEKERVEKERLEKERLTKLKSREDDAESNLQKVDSEETKEEMRLDLGVPYFNFQVSCPEDRSGMKILQSSKLPTVDKILDGLGLGPSGPPMPPPCSFSVVLFPEIRTLPSVQETLGHFTFIATSPDDPNVFVDEKKENEPEADPVFPVPVLKEEQLTPTKSRTKKEKATDAGRESQKDKRRSASVQKSKQSQESHSPPPAPRTPLSDVDQTSIIGEAMQEKLLRLSTFRWIVPAGGEVSLKIHFASSSIGNFDQTLNFELLGTRRRYQLYCRGVCAFPSICTDPRVVFPNRKKEARPDEIIHKKFILNNGTYDFGPLLCGKTREKYKAGQFPENMEKLFICNKSPVDSEITFCFQHDVKAVTFILDPPTMHLKPNQQQELSIWAYPTSPGLFEDNIVCCIKDNPEPAIFHICCRGVRPELELDRKQIHFDKILLQRKDTRTVFLRNSTLLPAAWRLTGLENLGDDFSVSQDQGIVGPRSEYALQLHFKAARATNVKKLIRLEVSDVENILGIVQLENIQVWAESYDVALDISFPKGRDGGLDFGVVKVNDEAKHTLSLKNKGKYEISFSFSLDVMGPGMSDLNSFFTILPQKGTLSSSDRATQVQILFQSKKEVQIADKPILRCQIIEPSLGEGGETIASIPIRLSVQSVFAKYRLSPSSDINFGAMVLGTRKQSSFTLENCGSLEFRYMISKMIREVIIQPLKRGPGPSTKRVRSREGSGSSRSLALNKSKRADSQTKEVNFAGQARLSLGMFTVSPGFGTVQPGGHVTVNIECFADQLGKSEEFLAIDISDRHPEDHSNGIPFRLVTESCTPGFMTDDFASIFEEHRILGDARTLQYLPALQAGGIYLQEENRFLFWNVLVGQTSTARFKIQNTGKVPCDVVLSVKPISSKTAARINDIFEVNPPRMNIPSHSHCYAIMTFTPQSMQTYQCIFEASLEGTGSALSKNRNLSFDISGEGNLPRITILRPVLRNKHGNPLLLFQRLLTGQFQQLPLILKNDGSIPTRIYIDVPGESGVFSLKPKSNTHCIYPAWGLGGELELPCTGHRPHAASLILHPGDVAEFDITFSPISPQRYEAILPISVVDNQYEQSYVQLVGEGYQDDLTLDNIHSPGEVIVPEELIEDDIIEATRTDHIIFGDCHIAQPYQVTFTMTNHSKIDAMRFQWPSEGPLHFSPQVGHIHTGCSKDVTLTLKSDVVLTLSKTPIKCKVSRISFPLHLDQVADWDDRMRTVKWVDSGKSPVGQQSTKKKVIETDPEPAHVELDEGSRELELLVTAKVDHAQFMADCDQVQFKDTLLYQTRVYKYLMKNIGSVQLQFSWQILMNIQEKSASFSPRCPSIDVQPSSGTIPAGGSQEFLIKFSPLEVGEFDARLTCSIPNLGMNQQAPVLIVKGRSILPFCHFQLEDSDYISKGRRNPELQGPHGAPSGTTLDPKTRVIEFTSVGIKTKNTRSFSILNPTSSPYSILWNCEDLQDFQTSPAFHCLNEHGIIQPGKKMEVTFEYVSQVLDITESFWSFTIPEQNISVPFLLVGKASEPSVSLDRSHHNFYSIFVGHELEEIVYLINNENKPFSYTFRENSRFSEGFSQSLLVKPMEGTISPLSRLPICISIKPTQVGELNFNLICDIHTKTKPLCLNVKAEGHTTDVCVQCQDNTGALTTLASQETNEIDFGQVDVHDSASLQFNIMNNGRFPFSFSCALSTNESVKDCITIHPDNGYVGPGQVAHCSLVFHPTKKCTLKDIQLIIKIENGPELRCFLNGKAVRPGIHFSFTQYNFGNCFIYHAGMQPIRKTLIITNKDEREVSMDCLYSNTAHIEVDFHADVLIPGGQMEIPITFYPRAAIAYQETVIFQMNGHSKQAVNLQGQGIEMKVEVADPKYKVTNCGAVSIGQVVKKSIPIVNNSLCPVTCKIILSPSIPALQDPKVLSLSPSSEITIPPRGGICKLELQFNPKERIAQFAEEVMLEAYGVTRSLLVLRGCSQGLELSLDQEYISFGAVVIQCQATRRIILSNTGELGARFKWDSEKFQPDFSISPAFGYITAGTDVTFEIVFHPREIAADIHYENLSCFIEGSKALKLTLSGSCVGLPSTKEVVSFQCHVRSKQTQTILLVNKTNQAWNLHPIIDGEQWSGLDFITVEAQQNKPYEITYRPITMTSEGKKHQGSIFFPLPDGAGLLYLLHGIADPPKSSGNIIREVPCKTPYTELLSVANWLNKTQRFHAIVEVVKPDRLDSTTTIKGLEYIEVPAASKRDYKLSFHSYKEGTFSIKVTFRNEATQEYLFYFVTFKATPPGIITTIEMVTPVRQSTVATVKMENPLSVPVTFMTDCKVAEINLPPQLTVPAQSEGSLMFEYQPLKSGESTGRLTLQSSDLGLFQYELLLKATPALSEKPLYFRTTLGSSQTLSAKFTNYTRQKTEYTCKVDNSDFHVEKLVTAAPGSQGGSEVSVEVTYEPVQLGESRAVLLISSPLGGEYTIPLFGSSLSPKPQGPIQIRSGASITIPFKNVFQQTTAFTFQTDPPAFTVKPCEPVRPKKTHYISVSYDAAHPGSKVPVTGKLVISCPRATGIAQGIYWVYYLKGVVSEK